MPHKETLFWQKRTHIPVDEWGEAPITDHLRDYVPDLEKYKVVKKL